MNYTQPSLKKVIMITPQLYLNEKERSVQTPTVYNPAGLLSEKEYDDLKKVATQICKTPTAQVLLAGPTGQFCTLGNNLNTSKAPLSETAFFVNNNALAQESIFVSDIRTNDRFNKNGSVCFYARIPLTTTGGDFFGALCITNNQPNNTNEGQKLALKSLADQTACLLQARIKNLELKESQKRLTVLALEKQKFVYAVAHDLKEPGRMIKALLTLLEKETGDLLNSSAKKYLNRAIDRVENQDDLINDLLEYATMIIEKKDQRKEINLSNIINEVNELLSDLIERKNVVIKVSEMPKLYTVPVALKQTLQNLITNAIKYQLPGVVPEITIAAKEEDAYWQISVSDNGIGIPVEFLETIFNPLERLHRKDQYPGTGLGLAICKKNIEQLGGKIWAQSEIGKGSTFYFSVPK